jgi:hypothetical protein
MVCSDRRAELSFYRRASNRGGCGEVDMLAAIPASGWARRGCCRVLLCQAMRLAATARSGEAGLGRIASVSVASAADQGSLLRRRRLRVLVEGVSGSVAVSR